MTYHFLYKTVRHDGRYYIGMHSTDDLKTDTEEARVKKGDSIRGTKWVNNGIICKRLAYCPEGWVGGRL